MLAPTLCSCSKTRTIAAWTTWFARILIDSLYERGSELSEPGQFKRRQYTSLSTKPPNWHWLAPGRLRAMRQRRRRHHRTYRRLDLLDDIVGPTAITQRRRFYGAWPPLSSVEQESKVPAIRDAHLRRLSGVRSSRKFSAFSGYARCEGCI